MNLWLVIALLILFAGLLAAAAVQAVMIRRLRHDRSTLLSQKDIMYGFTHDVGEVFADAGDVDLDAVLRRALFYAMRVSRAEASAIYLAERNDPDVLTVHALSGLFPPLDYLEPGSLSKVASKAQHLEQRVRNQRIQRGHGLIGQVADLGSPILIEDAERDPRVPRYDDDFLKIRSALLVPIRFQRRVLGVLAVVNRVDAQPFSEADQSLLQALAEQAAVTIHFDEVRETLSQKERIDHDLDVARQIQSLLLPKFVPDLEGFDLAAYNGAALEVGGDYFDFIEVDERHLGMAVADVSGKGISGAIMMAMCRSVLRSHARGVTDPAEVLRGVNAVLDMDMVEDMFVTMFYLVLDLQTGDIRYARAGHERPILARAAEAEIGLVDAPGMAVGIADSETFNQVLQEGRIKLQPGDMLLVYTDGVTEAMNHDREEWGRDRLVDTVRTAASGTAQSLLDRVLERVARFVGSAPQYDDTTLLALKAQARSDPEARD